MHDSLIILEGDCATTMDHIYHLANPLGGKFLSGSPNINPERPVGLRLFVLKLFEVMT